MNCKQIHLLGACHFHTSGPVYDLLVRLYDLAREAAGAFAL